MGICFISPDYLLVIRLVDKYIHDYADRFALREYLTSYTAIRHSALLPPLRLPTQIQIVLYRNLPSCDSVIATHQIDENLEADIIDRETIEKVNKKQLKELMKNVKVLHMVTSFSVLIDMFRMCYIHDT
jgi:hypothetical protein